MTTYPLIFDGHNDTLMHLALAPEGQDVQHFRDRGEAGHLDAPRAKAGGFGGGMFAVFVPPDPDVEEGMELGYAQGMAMRMMAALFRTEAQGDLTVARTVDEIKGCFQRGEIAAVLHFEGAEPIDPDLDALLVFYQAGLRSLGLTWSRPNVFAHGVQMGFPDGSPDTGPGLTDAGKALVSACNELGIVVDLSHLNEQGFWDVSKLSAAPLVATHSCVHAICATPRNLTDAQLDAIAASNGVVGLNFCLGFLDPQRRRDPELPLSVMVRHIDHMVARMGIDHVAIGSDFDGAPIPAAIGDAAGLPKLMDALRDAGYDADALHKIAQENWLRVLAATWKD